MLCLDPCSDEFLYDLLRLRNCDFLLRALRDIARWSVTVAVYFIHTFLEVSADFVNALAAVSETLDCFLELAVEFLVWACLA